ncbi:hypothetical protein CMV14_22465 [Rhizorhabdus dicambivorans]|nr:hypothetical protein CMV14_22465 [Rhizorhabdus dicambivorans]
MGAQGFAPQPFGAQGLAPQPLGAHGFASQLLPAQGAAAQPDAWSAITAPAGASAGASASLEQAAVAMVRPPITASMEASLVFFMGQTPFMSRTR